MYRLHILTPEQVVMDADVSALIAPGQAGYFGVLTDHAPLFSALKTGPLIVTNAEGKKSYYHISGGFLEVSNNKASILVETIETSQPIDLGIQEGI